MSIFRLIARLVELAGASSFLIELMARVTLVLPRRRITLETQEDRLVCYELARGYSLDVNSSQIVSPKL